MCGRQMPGRGSDELIEFDPRILHFRTDQWPGWSLPKVVPPFSSENIFRDPYPDIAKILFIFWIFCIFTASGQHASKSLLTLCKRDYLCEFIHNLVLILQPLLRLPWVTCLMHVGPGCHRIVVMCCFLYHLEYSATGLFVFLDGSYDVLLLTLKKTTEEYLGRHAWKSLLRVNR